MDAECAQRSGALSSSVQSRREKEDRDARFNRSCESKKILLAASVALAIASPAYAQKQKLDACAGGDQLATKMIEARDAGIPESLMLKTLDDSFNKYSTTYSNNEQVRQFTKRMATIFFEHPKIGIEEAKDMFLGTCERVNEEGE